MAGLYSFLDKHKTVLFVTALVCGLVYFVLRGWGESLGMDPEFLEEIKTAAQSAWGFLMTLIMSTVLADRNQNGVPDGFEDTPSE